VVTLLKADMRDAQSAGNHTCVHTASSHAKVRYLEQPTAVVWYASSSIVVCQYMVVQQDCFCICNDELTAHKHSHATISSSHAAHTVQQHTQHTLGKVLTVVLSVSGVCCSTAAVTQSLLSSPAVAARKLR
jgi:hypothetical protein